MFHEYGLDCGLDGLGIVRFLVEARDFLFSLMSRLSLSLSSLLFSRYWGKSGQDVKLTTLFRVVAR
jgi:hypothetical protein